MKKLRTRFHTLSMPLSDWQVVSFTIALIMHKMPFALLRLLSHWDKMIYLVSFFFANFQTSWSLIAFNFSLIVFFCWLLQTSERLLGNRYSHLVLPNRVVICGFLISISQIRQISVLIGEKSA